MIVSKAEQRAKLLDLIEIQNRVVTASKYFDQATKGGFINHSDILLNLLNDKSEKNGLTLTQLKSLTSNVLIYWNESIGVDTEIFWTELENKRIDIERRDELKFALKKGKFRRVDQGMGTKSHWQEMRVLNSVTSRFTGDEIAAIGRIVDSDEKARLEVLRKCLKKKGIPQSLYLKYGECMAYFATCGLFEKYFSTEQVEELYQIWKNF